jgi:hypothetical protein
MDNEQILNNKEAMISFLKIKKDFPSVMVPSFISGYLEESSEEHLCRKKLMTISKKSIIDFYDKGLYYETVEEFNAHVVEIEARSNIIKFLEIESLHNIHVFKDWPCRDWLFNEKKLLSERHRLADATPGFCMFEINDTLKVLCYKTGLITMYETSEVDIDTEGKYVDCFLKQNGFPYMIIEDNYSGRRNIDGPPQGSKNGFIYDFETRRLIDIYVYQSIAYGSKYIAYIKDKLVYVYDHDHKHVLTACGEFEEAPTTIDNGLLTVYYMNLDNSRRNLDVYDINYSFRKRIMALALCKQQKHVPKEIYILIYSFMAL